MRWSPLFTLLLAAAVAGCLSPPGAGDDGPTASESLSATSGPRPTSRPPAPGGGFSGNGTLPENQTEGNGTTFAREWAPLGTATIRPGVQVVADGSQCTSNFLFTSPDNLTVYVGFAAHCVTHNDPNSAVDGCDSASDPMDVGTRVEVEGADHPATLAYTSWGSMQERGGASNDACAYNDFAVAILDPRDAAKANPAMLFFGGPTELADPGDVAMLDKVLSYGDSGLRAGLSSLSPHEGYVISSPGEGGWTTEVYTAPQGIPGDSGSGVLLSTGPALGVLVTISLAGGSNGVTTLANAMEAAAEAGVPLRLATADLIDSGTLPGI